MNRTEMILKRPFKASQLKWRKGPGGKELVYITARDVMDRLDEAVGIEGWSSHLREVEGRVTCELSIRFGERWITKTDGAGDTGIEGEKGAISDSLKRSAVLWGIGRYLYHPQAFQGRTPAEWATPEGYEKFMAKKHKKEIEEFRRELGND